MGGKLTTILEQSAPKPPPAVRPEPEGTERTVLRAFLYTLAALCCLYYPVSLVIHAAVDARTAAAGEPVKSRETSATPILIVAVALAGLAASSKASTA